MSEAQKSGGNTKFVVVGLLLLGGAIAIFMSLSPSAPPPPPPEAPPAPVEEVERVNPMAQQFELEAPEEPVDAGVPEPEPEPEKPKRKKIAKRDAWSCAGELDAAKLQTLIRNNRGQVTTCYEKRLKRDNMLQGSLKLTIKIGKDGRVAATKVGGNMHDAELNACVQKAAKSWTFPQPAGDNCAVLSIPFQLSPKN